MESSDHIQPPPYSRSSPVHPDGPSLHCLDEKFRHYYFFKKKDGWMPALMDFIGKNKGEYGVDLSDKETKLRIALPDRNYITLLYRNLQEIRRTLDTAMKKVRLHDYWEIDEKCELEQREAIAEKYKHMYRWDLGFDSKFRELEATKTDSVKEMERQQFVGRFFGK
ncbi:hypothetical protein FMUND_15388 [Fusarium mundagurra]|uniref:Uncharacterized protein n=1 Tax=Fusarium mundagurra TaxID=1567541 RepID=A0A8H5XQ09_9HYPO|nr:hypothetical protein FMUND_15388 [Fusarium mundagurra]